MRSFLGENLRRAPRHSVKPGCGDCWQEWGTLQLSVAAYYQMSARSIGSGALASIINNPINSMVTPGHSTNQVLLPVFSQDVASWVASWLNNILVNQRYVLARRMVLRMLPLAKWGGAPRLWSKIHTRPGKLKRGRGTNTPDGNMGADILRRVTARFMQLRTKSSPHFFVIFTKKIFLTFGKWANLHHFQAGIE